MKTEPADVLRTVIILLGVIALCAGLSFALSHCASRTVNQPRPLAGHHTGFARVHSVPAAGSSTPVKSEPRYSTGAGFVTPLSRRYLSLLRFNSGHFPGEYLLAYEIPAPAAPQFAKNYRPSVNPALNWVLFSDSVPSRVNAWKETNIIYRHIQQA